MNQFYYAKLDDKNIVESVITLSKPHKEFNLIELNSLDMSIIGKKYNSNGTFEETINYAVPFFNTSIESTESYLNYPAPSLNEPIELTQLDMIETSILRLETKIDKLLEKLSK